MSALTTPGEIAVAVTQIMLDLNSVCVASRRLGNPEGGQAYDLLSKAWDASYDARAILERVPVS